MMEGDITQSLFHDMNTVVNEERLDRMIFLFMQVIEELPQNLVEQLGLDAEKAEYEKMLIDIPFRRKLELFYDVTTGEERKAYYDERFDHSPRYDFDEELYREITINKLKIVTLIGKVKRMINPEIDLDFGGEE